MIPSLQEATAAPMEGFEAFEWLKRIDRPRDNAPVGRATAAVDLLGTAAPGPSVVTSQTPTSVLRETPAETGFEERIFGVLVGLKVAIAEFATHLTREQRAHMFGQLDRLINADDWHEGDEFPRPQAFRDLLRWSIHSAFYNWSSLGVSDEGNILVAWANSRAQLTANFGGDGQVRWTSRVQTAADAAPAMAAGKCSLLYFTKQAKFIMTE
jgi:hypothetical protein